MLKLKFTAATVFLLLALLSGLRGDCDRLQAADNAGGLSEKQALTLLIDQIDRSGDSAVQAALMRGMLSGLEGRRRISPPTAWARVGEKLAASDRPEVRKLAEQLSQLFGDAEATRRSIAMLTNQEATLANRRSALKTLLMQQNEEVVELLPALLNEPELRIDAIRGFAEIETPAAPNILLSRFPRWGAAPQRAVIETLASRETYARELLRAIKNGAVAREDVPSHVARSLDLILGDEFRRVFGDVRRLDEDRQQLMARYKAMITDEALAQADASRGRAVFEKTCASCHRLYGTGGKIGPDLTGSNRANLDYILLNSVDPSYDVPKGYKMVIVHTVDGRLLSGVVAEEDSQRVILKTVEQPTVVIAKDEIAARKVSTKSMMPDGQLEQMKPQQVIDLIKYLRTTEQVEMPK